MKNNNNKEIPEEALNTLPDGYCILGWGGEWLASKGAFEGLAYLCRWGEPRPWCGACSDLLYAAPQDSDIAKACRDGQDLPAIEPNWNGGKQDVNRELQREIAELHDSPWISVKDRLPRKEDGGETGEVLVGDVKEKTFGYKRWTLTNPDSWYTHWMPIPSLPVDEAQAAFKGWYKPSRGTHRKEQNVAFLAGYEAAKKKSKP